MNNQDGILDEEFSDMNLVFERFNFRGKLAGKKWKYDQAVDRINQTRYLIFVMAGIMFYRLIINYLFHDFWSNEIFVERAIFSGILILCGLFFKKNPLICMIIATLPIIILLASYLSDAQYFSIKIVGFNLALLLILIGGIYFYFSEKKIKKELITAIQSKDTNLVTPK